MSWLQLTHAEKAAVITILLGLLLYQLRDIGLAYLARRKARRRHG